MHPRAYLPAHPSVLCTFSLFQGSHNNYVITVAFSHYCSISVITAAICVITAACKYHYCSMAKLCRSSKTHIMNISALKGGEIVLYL